MGVPTAIRKAWPLLFQIIFGRTFFCTEIITQFMPRIWNTVL
jgi:hypothetical protein